MKKELVFYGSTTVGERGQISLPAGLRRDYHIKTGDKLVILGKQGGVGVILLFKGEVLAKLIEDFEKDLKDIIKHI